MVDKTTPRLGLPVPFLTNPLKIDVGKLTEALTMLDANAVMLTDWDITADGWQKMGTITDLAQGKIALTLMVITGTGFANIVMQTGDGSVTTVGDPARISVTAQTNLGTNEPTILGGKVVETAEDSYEVWFNIAPSTAPRKWSALLAAGNGAKIDWTHTVGAQPAGGVTILIARSLTDQEIASPTITRNGAVLTAGYAGLMGINLPYFDFAATGDTIISHIWRVGETMRVKAADAITANGWPAGITGAGATGWRVHCDGINEDRTSRVFIFASEGATPTWLYRLTRTGNNWSAPRRMYTSDNPPAASEVKAVAQMDGISTVINLNERILPAHYGVVSLTSVAGAVAANNFPFDEPGQLTVFPFGASGGVTQVYIAKSGRIASRSYDGSVFTDWRKTANSGVNDDITSMTRLSGPLKLGGDAVGDYDAVTLRQLKAASGGSGPTMNGVVNNFLGAVAWWNGSRAKIPAGYVAADGQVLSRLLYPEIAAAIDSGAVNNVTEALWIDSGDISRSTAWRTSYSKGGALGTAPGNVTPDAWFRVPDLNGATANAIKHLFLSGSSGAPAEPTMGQVWAQSSPEISGAFVTSTSNGDAGSANGAFHIVSQDTGGTWNSSGTDRSDAIGFNASWSNKTYGRGSQYQTTAGGAAVQGNTTNIGDLYPNHAVGIWIIRVSASFQAANTNFSVLNGDATKPSNNTQIAGGEIISDYQVGGVSECTVKLKAMGSIGGYYGARLSIANKSKGGTPVNLDFTDDGSLNVPAGLTAGTNISAPNFYGSQGGGFQIPTQGWTWNNVTNHAAAPFRISDITVARDTVVPIISGRTTTAAGYPTYAMIGQYVPALQTFGQILFAINGDNGAFGRSMMLMEGSFQGSYKASNASAQVDWTIAATPTSDERLKRKITDYDGRQSLSNIDAMELKTFIYKMDEKERVRRGVIAQQVMNIDPEYVHLVKPMESDVGTYTLDSNVLLLDAICAIQVLSKDLKAAQEQIAALQK